MSNKTVFFLPTRKGSERVKNKNTRPFAGVEDGLIGVKLSQLIESRLIDEIIVSTNDDDCISVAKKWNDPRICIIPRPEHLCLSQTNLKDLIDYVPTITDADHIVWGHCTTPIANAVDYDAAITRYFEALPKGFDSLIGVKKIQNFILNGDGKIINNTTDKLWPRTQDLNPLYEINHTIFIASRKIYETLHNRVGVRPLLHEMSEKKSFDIDWEEDFEIAEMLYESMQHKDCD